MGGISKGYTGETEKRILEAARIVFMKKGYDHTKMQDIADAAGISRTSLNYYFRGKQNLYKGILAQIFYSIIPSVESIISEKTPFLDKLNGIIDAYDDTFRENQTFPRFVFTEFQRNPRMIVEEFRNNKDAQKYLGDLAGLLENEMGKGNVRKLAFEQIIATFFSLLVSPYLMVPVISEYSAKDNKLADQMLDEHKVITKEMMRCLLNPSNE